MEQEKHISEPLVTVAMSSYNHEDYVEEAILSIINQTYKNIELIVIDDGSKDRTRDILSELQKQYGFFLEFHENQGICKTLNKAINQYANGKYIDFLASDDIMMPNKIEKQLKFFEENPEYDMVFGKVHMIDANGKIIENFKIFEPFDEPVKYISFDMLIDNNRIPAPSIMMRRSIWDKCGGYDENMIIEDFDLSLKIAHNGKIAYLDDYFAYYRWHGQNLSTQVFTIFTDTWKLVNRWKDRMSPDLAKKVLARRDSWTFCNLARMYKKESLKYFRLNHSYWDSFIVSNYLRGLVKLIFCWNNSKSVWK